MSTLQGWATSFGRGATQAVTASVQALTDPQLKSVFWRRAKQLLIWSLVLVALVHMLLLPVEWLLSLLMPQAWIDASLRAFRYSMSSTIPFTLVMVSRYLSVELFEDAYFAGLRARDPALVAHIQKNIPIYWDWEYVRHAFLVGFRQGTFGLLVLLFSPLFGIVIPLAQFGYKLRQMERFFWVPVFLAFCIGSTRPLALHVVRVWLNSRALMRELYDPVIARLKTMDRKQESTLDPRMEWYHGGSEAQRLGFSMTMGVFLEIPFIGPFTWFVAFVAAGLVTPELINTRAFSGKNT